MTYVQLVNIKNPAWYLPLSETSGTTAVAKVGPNGTYANTPQLGVDPIAQDDVGGFSVGLSGVTEEDAPSHITCLSPLSGPGFTVDLTVQFDTLINAKYTLITPAGSAAGTFGVEVLQNGQCRPTAIRQPALRT